MEDLTLKKKQNFILGLLGFVIPTLVIVLIVVIFYIGVTKISESTVKKQEDSLYTAIERDIVQCYSIEGIYPPSLEYLEEHYALAQRECVDPAAVHDDPLFVGKRRGDYDQGL